LGVLTEAIVFLITPIAAVPAAEALTFIFLAGMLGKMLDTGLGPGAAVNEQLWSAGNR